MGAQMAGVRALGEHLLRWVSISAVLAAWEGFARAHVVSDFLLPSLSSVLERLWSDIISGEVFVTNEKGEECRLGPGDVAFFPAGSRSTWRVPVAVRVRLSRRHFRTMIMLVMFVMTVTVFVFYLFMSMIMLMSLGQMQP